jgi:GMP synthase-like glutamine amidotransferase
MFDVVTDRVACTDDKNVWIELLAFEIRLLIVRTEAKRIHILGVCFGHQILVRTLGEEVTPHPQGKFFGVRRFLVSAHAQQGLPWCKTHMTVFYSHGHVVSRLPPGAQSLGCSSRCGVEGMCVVTHILSLQGHPELDVGDSITYLRCVTICVRSHLIWSPKE